MPEIPVHLNLPDQEAVGSEGQALDNIIVTSLGQQFVSKIRQGAIDFLDTGTSAGIDGIFHWQSKNMVVVVSNGSVFKITVGSPGIAESILLEDGSTMLLEDGSIALLEPAFVTTDITNDAFVVGTKVKFADAGNYLYAANGNKIKELHSTVSQVSHGGNDYTAILNSYGVTPPNATYWQDDGAGSSYTAWSATTRYGSGTFDDLEDASWPTVVKQIGVAEQYLLAIEDGTERTHYSFPSAFWRSDGDFVKSSGLADIATALVIADGDVFIGGPQSVQQFQNTPSQAWVTSEYGAYTGSGAGLLAPYSMTYARGALYYINEKRQFVVLAGRVPQSLNRSFDTWLQSVDVVTDCLADWVVIDGINFLMLFFPSSDRSAQINLDNMSWSEVTDGTEDRINYNGIINVPDWDMVLAGDKAGGWLLEIASAYRTDSGTAINAVIRTPRLKITPAAQRLVAGAVSLSVTKLTSSQEVGDASISVRWRDDGKDWSTTRTHTFSDDSVTDDTVHFWRCGSYNRNRQYEITMSDLYPYSLINMMQE